VQTNANLGSDVATYQVHTARQVEQGVFDVTLTVSGDSRTTQFVLENGEYVHKLTSEEYAMFNDGLSGEVATASATASASATAGQPDGAAGSVNSEDRVVLTGDAGTAHCSVMDADGQRSVDSPVPGEIAMDAGGMFDVVGVSCQKARAGGTLTVQLVVDGKVEAAQTTSAQYGVVTVNY
jgi:hypothetical protein